MKNLYKQFNDIEIDIEKLEAIDAELDDLTKRKIKNNIRNSIKTEKSKQLFKIGILAVAASFLFCIIMITGQHTLATFANNIPILNTFFHKFESGYGGNFQNYTQIINKAEEDKGYEVKMNEVVMDDFSLKLIYTIKCPKKISEFTSNGNPFPHTPAKSIKINGKDFLGGCGGMSREIDDYTVQIIEDYFISEMDIPQNIDVEIDFKEINKVAGNWNFNFHVSKEKISKDIKNYILKKQLKIQNGGGKEVTLTFERISFSPISTTVQIKANNSFEYNTLIFKDDKGNILKSAGSSFDAHNGALGYTATGLYKFEPIEKIPDKIFVEYTNPNSKQSSAIDLILK